MTLFKIQVGEFIQLNGHKYRIGRMLETGEFLLEALNGKTTSVAVTRGELEKAFSKGQLEFLVESWAKAAAVGTLPAKVADYSQVPDALKAIVERRLAYVKAARQVPDLRWVPEYIEPILSATAGQLGEGKAPHPKTVRMWYRAYMEADQDVRALIPAFGRRGGKFRRLDPLVVAIVEAKIERYYLTPERHTVEDIIAFVIAEISQLNRARSPRDQLKNPSRATVYAEIQKLDEYMVHAARYGQKSADQRFKQTGKYPQPKRPLEKVEIDHTKSDLMVVDDQTKLPIGRPWITAAIDVHSRMIYGIHIGFVPPSFVSVMHCLRNGIMPKSWLREEYPQVENEWPVHGIPEAIHCDNGKEFHSNAFEHAVSQLGTEIVYCSVMEPNQKGSIERFLGVVNRGLLQHKPGTTFSNIFDRGDYDPAKNAVIPFSLLKAIIMKWICDVYHVKFHRGIGAVPLKAYRRASVEYPSPGLPRHVDDLVVLFGRTVERTVQHTGIELNGLFYNAPALAVVRARLHGKKTLVRFNEEDLGTAHVYDPLERIYVPAPCTEPEYARGLSLWQHDVIRRYANASGMAEQDEVALANAKAEIQKMVEEAWLKPSKTGHKQKMARWLGVGGATELNLLKDIPMADVPPAIEDEELTPAANAVGARVPYPTGEGWGFEGDRTN